MVATAAAEQRNKIRQEIENGFASSAAFVNEN